MKSLVKNKKYCKICDSFYCCWYLPAVDYRKMKTSLQAVFCLVTLKAILGINIGVIHQASMVFAYANTSMYASNCNECLCAMLMPSVNEFIVLMNCYTNSSNNVLCQMFSNSSSLNSSGFQLDSNVNSTCYFHSWLINYLVPITTQASEYIEINTFGDENKNKSIHYQALVE